MITFGTLVTKRIQYDWDTHCWNYTGYKIKDGYGRMTFRGRERLAHRVSLFLRGRITWEQFDSRDNVVMHTCDNPACINPDHLRLGTQLDNIRDRKAKGRCAKHYENRDPITKKFIKKSTGSA